MTQVEIAQRAFSFADRIERLELASHRSHEGPYMAREELAAEVRSWARSLVFGEETGEARGRIVQLATGDRVIAGRVVRVERRRRAA